jgi:iron complex outermembrane receptor protein
VHPIANATLKYTHKFNPDWSITAIADYNYTREYVPAANLTFDGVSQLDLGNSNYRFTPHEDTFQGEIDLKGKFETAFIKHDVLLGVYRRNSWRIMDTVIAAPPSPEAINIFYPIYPNTACFFGGPGCPLVDGAAQIDVKTRTQMNAAYAQDLIRLTEQFKLLVGGRYDRVIEWDEFKNPDQNFGGDSLTITKYGFFSPHVGGVFQPFKETSIFAAWGKSFAPNFTLLGPGRPAPPEYSTQIDVGVKQDLFDGRAQVGITAFDIERTNIVVADPTDPLGQRNLLLGKYKSHGLEFDLGGEILPNFRVNAALTFMHGVAGKDTNTPTSEGSELNFSPRRFYNFTGIYSFKEGALKGLQLGANFYYASKTPALFPNGPAANFYALQNGGLSISGQNQYPFQIAPIYSFGLYASYEITDCLKVQVNANNLFDRANWQTAGNGFMARGVPRSIFANISYQFK